VLKDAAREAATLQEPGESAPGGLGVVAGELAGPVLGDLDGAFALPFVVEGGERLLDRDGVDSAPAELRGHCRPAPSLALGLAAHDGFRQSRVVEVASVLEPGDLRLDLIRLDAAVGEPVAASPPRTCRDG
jgi:hypothetical protein